MGGRVSGVRARVRTRRVVKGSVPAAATDPTLTVPGGHVYRPCTVYATLATDANVGVRTPLLIVTVDGETVAQIPCEGEQDASTTFAYTWAILAAPVIGDGFAVTTIPELVLPPGAVLTIDTSGIEAGDQWSALAIYTTDEWIQRGPIDLTRPELELVAVIEPSA